MAVFNPSTIILGIKGSAGNVTFQGNRLGNFIKPKASPFNKNTIWQAQYRQIWGNLSKQWSLLTDAQRYSYISGASAYPWVDKFGNIKYLSGQALFMQININLLLNDQFMQSTLPTYGSAVQTVINAWSCGTGSDPAMSIDLVDAVAVGMSALIYATPPLSIGISNFNNKLLRLPTAYANSAGATLSFGSDYWSKITNFIPGGCRIGISLVTFNASTGVRSVPSLISMEP